MAKIKIDEEKKKKEAAFQKKMKYIQLEMK